MILSTIISFLVFFDSNITNFTHQWVYDSFQPYIHIFGGLFWGMFFGIIGAAIYVSGEGDNRIYLVLAGYFIIVGIIFGIALTMPVIAIFGLILTFIVTNVFYRTFFESR